MAPDESEIAQLASYFTLLSRWNEKINLTALPLQRPTDQTFDRLFAEPLAASRYFPSAPTSWLDLGSGGGSPALPLKIVRASASLTMVEAKARKAAFLREVVRTLGLTGARVENVRFEGMVDQAAGSAMIVTVRAVRADELLFRVAHELLMPGGRLFLFLPGPAQLSARGFSHLETVPLLDSRSSYLGIYGRLFHVEHPG